MLSVDNSELLSIDQLAEILGITPRTVVEWRAKGVGPKRIRIGRRTFFRASDVARWLEACEPK